MRRAEAVALAFVALLMISSGVTWLFGALGLIVVGTVLLAFILFFTDVRE